MADENLFDSVPADKEEWRPVPGWEDLYAASNHGRVKKISIKGRPECILKPGIVRRYPHVSLWRNGKETARYVHQVIAWTFIGPTPEGQQVNHKDFDHLNNRPSNLEYLTPQGNRRHSFEGGACLGKNLGARYPSRHKVTDGQIQEIRELHGRMTLREIAAKFGISRGYVCAICRGRASRGPDTALPNISPPQLRGPKSGASVVHKKLSCEQAEEIKRRIRAGEAQSDLAKEFGVSASAINHLWTGRQWAYIH